MDSSCFEISLKMSHRFERFGIASAFLEALQSDVNKFYPYISLYYRCNGQRKEMILFKSFHP